MLVLGLALAGGATWFGPFFSSADGTGHGCLNGPQALSCPRELPLVADEGGGAGGGDGRRRVVHCGLGMAGEG